MQIKDWAGTEYTAEALKGQMATTGKGQSVEILRVSGTDAQIAYPNGRRGWEPMTELLVSTGEG